ncbi:hypothetical protein LWI29_005974 [Acer saccharum]|uniref:Uncharacterized protein n=1 Tax=Acer saccharum TaxID=4024 RepID=A0AA39T2W7_ACESA|nr:hypothetical protein LWI29_005974 [Acer saccharum]
MAEYPPRVWASHFTCPHEPIHTSICYTFEANGGSLLVSGLTEFGFEDDNGYDNRLNRASHLCDRVHSS